MATITMDTSEYEGLKKNIELLQEAAKREKELNQEIQNLKNEKILTLMDAEKSVSIITKSVKVDHVILKKSYQDVLKACNHVIHSNLLSKVSESERVRVLIDYLFEQRTEETMIDVSVVTKGFDEVKAEMQEKFKKEFEGEIAFSKKKIENLEKDQADNFEALADLTMYKNKAFEFESKFNKKEQDLVKTMIAFNDYIKQSSDILQFSSWNMFNFSKRREELLNIPK
jgi:hypothetical protein